MTDTTPLIPADIEAATRTGFADLLVALTISAIATRSLAWLGARHDPHPEPSVDFERYRFPHLVGDVTISREGSGDRQDIAGYIARPDGSGVTLYTGQTYASETTWPDPHRFITGPLGTTRSVPTDAEVLMLNQVLSALGWINTTEES